MKKTVERRVVLGRERDRRKAWKATNNLVVSFMSLSFYSFIIRHS